MSKIIHFKHLIITGLAITILTGCSEKKSVTPQAGGGRRWGQILTDLLDGLFDIASAGEDLSQLVGHFRFVTDPAVQNGSGRGQDFIDRQCHFPANGLDRLAGGTAFLGGE